MQIGVGSILITLLNEKKICFTWVIQINEIIFVTCVVYNDYFNLIDV